jgi:hypothetical protein
MTLEGVISSSISVHGYAEVKQGSGGGDHCDRPRYFQ